MDQPNPTPSNGDASTLDRIEAFLSAGEGDDQTSNQDAAPGNTPDNEPDDKPDGTPDKPESDDQAKVTEPQITTAQLAAFLGIEESEIDVDDAGQPVFKTKIDGKESAAKFSDIRKAHQLQGHAENTTREAAAIKQAAEARMQEAEQAIAARFQQAEQQMQQLAEIAQIQQQELKQDYDSIDWPQLWQTDAGRAGILRDQFQAKAARIQAALQNVNQKREAAMQQARQQQQVNAQRALQAEAQKLREAIPEWSDRATAEKEQGELTEWALSRGYDRGYLQALHSAMVPNAAVVIRDLRNAWKHDTLAKAKPRIENLVRSAPKLVKPGQAPANTGNAATLKSLKQNVRNATGGNSTKAVADWLLASGKA